MRRKRAATLLAGGRPCLSEVRGPIETPLVRPRNDYRSGCKAFQKQYERVAYRGDENVSLDPSPLARKGSGAVDVDVGVHVEYLVHHQIDDGDRAEHVDARFSRQPVRSVEKLRRQERCKEVDGRIRPCEAEGVQP